MVAQRSKHPLTSRCKSPTRRLLGPGGRRLPEVGERDQDQARSEEEGAARRIAERPKKFPSSARLRQKAAEIVLSPSPSAVLGKLSLSGERCRKSWISEVGRTRPQLKMGHINSQVQLQLHQRQFASKAIL